MNTAAKINVTSAEIRTATIEIHTLTVNSRKLTLSVFRQLYSEPLIDLGNMELNGIPWGRVNYFWGDLPSYEGCMNVVWQKGNELRRSVVTPDINNDPYIKRLEAIYKYLGNICESKCGDTVFAYRKYLNNLGWYATLIPEDRDMWDSDSVGATQEVAMSKCQGLRETIKDKYKAYHRLYQQLVDLPHLIIAV